MAEPSPSAVSFRQVSRHYGEVRAVDDVSFDIADGEFFSMLGPSGSGKTTCLRLIAGFEQPSAGEVVVHGRNMAGVPPYERDVNTVFQDYALFPHMTVAENVAYGLMIRRVPKAERQAEAEKMLAMVALGGLGGRRPSQLSGGQRQRVALARALVNKPGVLLLDEPLGALDLKLREQMQVELKAIQRQVGITFIYVTHDQGEALSMSDRIAVFNKGRIEQIGSPAEIYEHPASVFVAGFVGVSNLVSGPAAAAIPGVPPAFSIRPEKIHIAAPGSAAPADACAVDGTISSVLYLGASTRFHVALAGRRRADGDRPEPGGDGLHRRWPARARRCGSSGSAPISRKCGNERRGRADPAWSAGAPGAIGRLSTFLYLRPRLVLLLLLLPPLLWLGIVYVGSLLALLAQSFFSVDDFSGLVVYQPTLSTYAELFTPANLTIILRTVVMATAVTLGCAAIAFPLAYYMARFAGPRAKAVFYIAVMLPLWSNYLVRVYSWKLILAKEGVLTWLFNLVGLGGLLDGALGAAGHRRALALRLLYRHVHRLHLYLAALHDPAGRGGAGAGAAQLHRGLGRSRRQAAGDLPQCHPAAGDSRRGGGLDLHLLADPGRLHHSQSDRQFAALRGHGGLQPIRAPPGTSRWPPPSPWCRSW